MYIKLSVDDKISPILKLQTEDNIFHTPYIFEADVMQLGRSIWYFSDSCNGFNAIVSLSPSNFTLLGTLNILMTIVIENSYYKNLVVTEIFGLLTFNFKSFLKPTPPQTRNCHLGAFQKVENHFFDSIWLKYWGCKSCWTKIYQWTVKRHCARLDCHTQYID